MRDLRTAVTVAALGLVAFWGTLQVPASSDATGHVQTAFSFVREGNADVDEYVDLRGPAGARRMTVDGHEYSPHTIGNALIYSPVAIGLTAAATDASSPIATNVMPKILASLAVSASIALVFLAVRALVDVRTALFIALAYGLGSGAFATSQEYTEQATSLLLNSAAIFFVVGPRGPRPAGAGIAMGLAAIVRPTNAFLGLAIFAQLFHERRGAAIRYVLWCLPALAFQATVDSLVLGSPFRTLRGALPLAWPLEGALGLMISPSRGLLVYTPWVGVGIAALLASWRGRADRPRRLLRYGSLAFVATWTLYSLYAEWWGGWSFGARYMTDLLPLYALGLADAWRRGWLRSTVARAALSVAVGWSILLQALGSGLFWTTWNGRHWDVTPNIDVTPWRLWDWTDTQWQFLLRRFVDDPPPAMIVESAVVVACVLAFVLLAARLPRREAAASRTGPVP